MLGAGLEQLTLDQPGVHRQRRTGVDALVRAGEPVPQLRAGWELNGAVGAGVGSTQGEDLHDLSIAAADLAATRIGRHVWEG
ncbi:MAG: hypothetical protein JWP11_3540 [Frankiales bacterium]|nr:hypothetical protein [Frankiales bacterium]